MFSVKFFVSGLPVTPPFFGRYLYTVHDLYSVVELYIIGFLVFYPSYSVVLMQ